MKTKYAVINTMCQSSDTPGMVLSLHTTEQAAESADSKLQRAVKKSNGQNSYLPTIIREVAWNTRKGYHPANSEIIA